MDSDAFHSTSTNTGRLTIPNGLAGDYQISLNVSFAANATGVRLMRLYKNGAAINSEGQSNNGLSGVATQLSATCVLPLVATDYIEINVRQSSGGALDISNASFQLVKVG